MLRGIEGLQLWYSYSEARCWVERLHTVTWAWQERFGRLLC